MADRRLNSVRPFGMIASLALVIAKYSYNNNSTHGGRIYTSETQTGCTRPRRRHFPLPSLSLFFLLETKFLVLTEEKGWKKRATTKKQNDEKSFARRHERDVAGVKLTPRAQLGENN